MIYLLIHSYSELNKGDAGIILATVQNIRKEDRDSEIFLYSTYGYNDKQFEEQHEFLKKYVDGIVPALFPELFLKIGDKHNYGSKAKAISLVWHLFRSSLLLLSPNFFSFLLHAKEKNSLKLMKESDFVISKGGSFLCNEGSNREFFALLRLFHPFFLAKILNKKTSIFGQSLGPIKGFFSQVLFRYGITKVDDVFIRETKTIELLKEDNIYLDKYNIVPDIAFSLKDSDGIVEKIILEDDCFKVGMTIVDFPFQSAYEKDQYIGAMCSAIIHVVRKYKAKVYIYPQVITIMPDGTTDIRLTQKIFSLLSETIRDNVIIFNKNYSPMDLKKMYGMMDIFIATRLHSAIFALGNIVPTINISYHGTKSEGTFALLELDEYVIRITTVDKKMLENKVDSLISHRDELKKLIEKNIAFINKEIENSIKYLMNN
jgi:polysaccharide pyruvyl transferase WcaK-like protein